jgi:hypothetical protein
MKKYVILFAIIFAAGIIYAQGFQPPSPGKAVVYFVRSNNYGFAISFQYFHQNKFIGEFKGSNYLRYECDPGKQLLWAHSENDEFIQTELKEGGTYIIQVDPIVGKKRLRVGFTPISINDIERFERNKKVVLSKPPVPQKPEVIEQKNLELSKMMEEKLQMYETQWKNEKNFRTLTIDMAIPESELKK